MSCFFSSDISLPETRNNVPAFWAGYKTACTGGSDPIRWCATDSRWEAGLWCTRLGSKGTAAGPGRRRIPVPATSADCPGRFFRERCFLWPRNNTSVCKGLKRTHGIALKNEIGKGTRQQSYNERLYGLAEIHWDRRGPNGFGIQMHKHNGHWEKPRWRNWTGPKSKIRCLFP